MKRTVNIFFSFLMFTAVGVTSNVYAQKKAVSKAPVASAKTKAGDFNKTENGVEYKIVKDAHSSQHANIGDFIEMHIGVFYNDSALYESRKMNNNQPVPNKMQKPAFKGDPAEVIVMLKPGDSAIIRVSVDSLEKAGQKLPPYMKPGTKIEYRVEMVSIKTEAQKKQEDAAKATLQNDIDNRLLTDYFAKNNIKATKTPTGLYYTITKEGTGPNAMSGQSVTVNYTGKTLDGKTFDSNVDSNFHHVQPFSFNLGQHQVISGWDEGVTLFKKGTKGTLYIPSPMAYGAQSPSPAIPANSVLIFDIEVTDIKAAESGH